MKSLPRQGFAPIMVIFLVFATLFVGGGFLYIASSTRAVPPTSKPSPIPRPIPTPTPTPSPTPRPPVACTMEAKLCPDGSAVGRTGPNCEFAPCPAPKPTPKPVPVTQTCGGTVKGTCAVGYQCIQACGPPVAREGDAPPPYYCETNEIASKPRMCPICLASNTMIATPDGEVNVKDLARGMKVWSLDARGNKIASTVLNASHTVVPSTHRVVHLVFADSREVWVSPQHPTIDGSRVQDLRAGDRYDGSRIVSTELVPYWDSATYDLLPDSETGAYWANGVLLGSTLKATK